MKKCSVCRLNKELQEFNQRQTKCKQCQSAYRRRYNEENKDRRNEYDRRWYADNREYKDAFSRKQMHERRALGVMPIDAYEILAGTYGELCLSCGATERLEIDHVVPVTLGGTNDLDNLQLLCKTCNCRKGNRSNADYRPAMLR